MCMKNVNLTVITANVLGNKNTKSISLGNVDKPYVYQMLNGKRTIVGPLSLVVFMQAIQTKDKEKLAGVDPSEKLLFAERYAIKIRLTETKSGKFLDVDEFALCPEEVGIEECVCCDTFSFTRMCIKDDVALPPKRENEFFVVKVLIKHLTGNNEIDENSPWIVQTVHPVSFVENPDI